MKEIFNLAKGNLPTIAVPHDCCVEKIYFEDGFLVFEFEDDISQYDSIKYDRPNVKTLTIKYHLILDEEDVSLYKMKRLGLFNKKIAYVETDRKKLFRLTENKFEYLSHLIGYGNILVSFCANGFYRLKIDCDYIEYDWIEK